MKVLCGEVGGKKSKAWSSKSTLRQMAPTTIATTPPIRSATYVERTRLTRRSAGTPSYNSVGNSTSARAGSTTLTAAKTRRHGSSGCVVNQVKRSPATATPRRVDSAADDACEPTRVSQVQVDGAILARAHRFIASATATSQPGQPRDIQHAPRDNHFHTIVRTYAAVRTLGA